MFLPGLPQAGCHPCTPHHHTPTPQRIGCLLRMGLQPAAFREREPMTQAPAELPMGSHHSGTILEALPLEALPLEALPPEARSPLQVQAGPRTLIPIHWHQSHPQHRGHPQHQRLPQN